MKKRSGFGWMEILVGILFIGLGIYAMVDPITALSSMVIVFGVGAIFRGVSHIVMYFTAKDYTTYSPVFLILMGIIDILLGVMLLGNIELGILTIATIFPIWFLVDCVANLGNSSMIKKASNGMYWFNIIVNVIGIILAILLLFDPIASTATFALLISFYLMLFGVRSMAVGFSDFGSKDFTI